MTRVITFGTYDLLHVGHVRILQRAAKMGDSLIVGVSSDDLNFTKKGRRPVYNERDRMEIVGNIKGVEAVFLEESLEKKAEYIRLWHANVLVMGDDWRGKFDFVSDICRVEYLERTEGISTTSLLDILGNK